MRVPSLPVFSAIVSLPLAAVLVLAIVPGWTGEERLGLLGKRAQMDATRVDLDPRDPHVRRVGALTYLGGVSLTSRDPAFGGFSSLAVQPGRDGDRFTLLSDGGNIVRFRMGSDWIPRALAFANLPAGPGTGWEKRDRDSESMVIDGMSGRVWVGYEGYNAIWRYTRGFAATDGHVTPHAMQGWPDNGGPEAMARLPDGRFVVVGETAHVPPRFWRGDARARLRTREAFVFARDPVAIGGQGPAFRFAYAPVGRYDVSDVAALPNGDLIVLDRAFSLPFRFSNRISRIAASEIRPGHVARADLLAVLDAPLIHDNFEGVAVTQEAGRTILWLVSDDNQLWLQRSLLLKFALEGNTAKNPPAR